MFVKNKTISFPLFLTVYRIEIVRKFGMSPSRLNRGEIALLQVCENYYPVVYVFKVW